MIDEIMEAIASAKYKDGGDKYEHSIVWNRTHLSILRGAIERAIRKHTEKDVEREAEIARLSAKVYTYESIIANSNFAPMFFNKKDGEAEVLWLKDGDQE